MAYEGIIKVDGYGKRFIGNVDVSTIEWITGAYTFTPNLTSVGGNTFDIPYAAGQLLFDQYTPAITGGSLAASVPTTETYVCPTIGAGAVTWADVNPAGAGVGLNYSVDGLMPAHLGRARSKTMNPYVYEGVDGYFYEMFLLFGFTPDAGFGIAGHYFYWVYVDSTTGLWTRVPNADPGLPSAGEIFDIWVPTSINVSNAKWSSWLVQDVDKLQGSGGSGDVGEQLKVEATITLANETTGLVAFTTVNLSTIAGTTIMGFQNGIEVNAVIGVPGVAGTDVDIILDSTSVGYPGVTDVYWNGTTYGANASLLGDAVIGDIIRLYYLSS